MIDWHRNKQVKFYPKHEFQNDADLRTHFVQVARRFPAELGGGQMRVSVHSGHVTLASTLNRVLHLQTIFHTDLHNQNGVR